MDIILNCLQKVECLVRKPEFQSTLNKFVDAWNEAGGSAWRKAEAIFYFLKGSYLLGILWKIIELIFNLMFKQPTWTEIRQIHQFVLMIVAAFTTERVALIARITLAVQNDVHLYLFFAQFSSINYLENFATKFYFQKKS
jgi:hypothetical protein